LKNFLKMSLPNSGQSMLNHPQMGYPIQPSPYMAQPGYLPYDPKAMVQQPMIVPQRPLLQPQQHPALHGQQPLLRAQPNSQKMPNPKLQQVSGQKVENPAPTSPNKTKKSVETRGEKRKLEEAKNSDNKIVKAEEGGKKTEIANSIQSFIKNLKIKKPKMTNSNEENQAPKARSSDHYLELFKKRQKLRDSVITKLPFQSVKRRTVVVTNIASFPSVLEVQKFIRDNLSAVGLFEGAEVEQIIVPQVDYYGTPKHTGYAQIVVKDVSYISRVIETFTRKVFCERVVNVAQT